MKRKSVRLAAAAVVVALLSGLAAASGGAATPTLTARLFAKAGPVTMHATMTLAGMQPTAPKVTGSLSSCVVQQVNKPRSGVAFKLVCKNAQGQRITVPAAPTAVTLTYQIASAQHSVNLQAATIQIRHKSSVLFILSAGGGTLTVPLDKTVDLMLNGHTNLYVQVGGHTYHGKISQVA